MKLSLHKRFEQFQHDQNTQRNVELVVNVLLVAVIAMFVIRPALTRIMTMNENKKIADDLLVQLTHKSAALEKAEELVAELQEDIPLYADALPDEPKQFDLLNTLRVAAEREEMVVEQLTHTAGTPGQVAFTMTGAGSYSQIIKYIEMLEKMPRLLEIEQIVVAKSVINDESIAPGLSVSISGYGYHYQDPVRLLHEQPSEE